MKKGSPRSAPTDPAFVPVSAREWSLLAASATSAADYQRGRGPHPGLDCGVIWLWTCDDCQAGQCGPCIEENETQTPGPGCDCEHEDWDGDRAT